MCVYISFRFLPIVSILLHLLFFLYSISINLFILSAFSVIVEKKSSYGEIHPYCLLGLSLLFQFGPLLHLECMLYGIHFMFSKFIFSQLSQHNLAKLIFAQWFAIPLLSNTKFLYVFGSISRLYIPLYWFACSFANTSLFSL